MGTLYFNFGTTEPTPTTCCAEVGCTFPESTWSPGIGNERLRPSRKSLAFHLDNRTTTMVTFLLKRCFFMIIVLKLNHILCMEKRLFANFSSNFLDMWSTEPSKPSAWAATFPIWLYGWMGRGQQMQIRRFAKGALEGGRLAAPQQKEKMG